MYEACKRDKLYLHADYNLATRRDHMKQARYNSFEELYEDNRKLVFTFILDYVKDLDILEDIASTVWLKIVKKGADFLEIDKKAIKYYLRAVVKTTVSDYFRSKKKEEETTLILKESLNDSGNGDDSSLFDEDIRDNLGKALELLTEDEKLLITLRFYEKMSARDIGKILNIEEGNVRVRQSRILKKLKKHMNGFKTSERENKNA